MKIFRKLRQRWNWIFGYTVVFGTTNGKYFKQYIVHHRIGRKPIMRIEERREALRGQHASILIFDEYLLTDTHALEQLMKKRGDQHDASRSN